MDRQVLKKAIELTNSYILNNHASSNMFAAIFFGILDPVSGILIYINAGYEPPLVFHQGSEVKERLNSTGLAVGMMPDVDFEVQQIQLEPGDTLLIFSDGVLEAKNPSGQSFGKEGLIELLEKTDLTATALLSEIETNLRAHIAETAQLDDITTLAIRRPA
jgi:serine phosphatase RsbU (regulator of sigma subunit)